MARVIKLGSFRKRKAREEERRRAEDNRRKHGRSKAEKLAARAERARLEQLVDGARLEDSQAPGDDEDPTS